jgi:hypothetical protein
MEKIRRRLLLSICTIVISIQAVLLGVIQPSF